MSLFDKINLPPVNQAYKVHTFTSTGTSTFAVTGSGDVEYLILAGGAGGASHYWAGGGGAGGLLQGTGKSVTAQNYSIVVGTGGAVQSTQHTAGNNGSNSTALGLTSIGGGGGATNGSGGNDGGSGGGSGGDSIGQASGQPTAGQGFAGGIAGNPSGTGSGSGGGGSGSVGIQATSGVGGNGGDGKSSIISGSIVFYGGGGAGGGNGTGGTGGQGGGGNGSAGSANGSNATGYGSGGGGGAHVSGGGGSGSSGIVIIRYKTSSGITATGGTITNTSELTGVANQRVVENFSGSVLDTDRWTSQVVTTGTVTMSDSLNGGINLATGTTSGGRAKIHFDNIRQFSPTGSAMIVVAQRDIDANNYSEMFLANDYSSSVNAEWADIYHRPDSTNIRLQTRDGSGYNNTDTGVARHINSMAYKLELKSASCELSLDGVVKAISTSALPTARLQPVFRTETDTTSSRSLNITYCEAYNT